MRMRRRGTKDLTKWTCPVAGGWSRKQLKGEDKALDKWARGVISEEMGHGRLGILSVYLG